MHVTKRYSEFLAKRRACYYQCSERTTHSLDPKKQISKGIRQSSGNSRFSRITIIPRNVSRSSNPSRRSDSESQIRLSAKSVAQKRDRHTPIIYSRFSIAP